MYVYGFLFERKRCLIELVLELLQVLWFQIARPLRLEQRAAEIGVSLGHVIRRCCRHFVDSVIHQPVQGRNRGIHALLLILQAGLEGLPQLHDDEISIELLCEDERRTRC